MNKLALRAAFLALLLGGLLYWAHLRQPRELAVRIDLTKELPGELSEVDVIVRRDGHVLARHDVQYGAGGAPGTLEFSVRATPGQAELETTLVAKSGPARRNVERVVLR